MVKALDLSPSGLSPRGFEPRRMQIFEIKAQKFFFYRKTPAIFLKYNKLGWCSWLSRAPHTREVPSSILGSNIFSPDQKITRGGIRTRGLLLRRETRYPLRYTDISPSAGLAQLVERWSHNPKVVSSILTPGSVLRG